MIHLWLPTLAHPSLGNISTGTLCPCCKNIDETQNHLHECKHPMMLQTWATSMNELNKKLNKAPIDPHIIKLITIAIRSWHDTKVPQKPEFLPKTYHNLFNKQSKIGWHHISKGRLSEAWKKQQKLWNPVNPERWIAYIITSIWTTVRQIWDVRNQQLHDSEAITQRETIMLQLEPKIRELYHKSNKLGAFDRKHFDRPIEEILQLPTTSIQQWIQKMKQKVKDGIIRETKRIENTTTTITTIWKKEKLHPKNKKTGKTTTTNPENNRTAATTKEHLQQQQITKTRSPENIQDSPYSTSTSTSTSTIEQTISEKNIIQKIRSRLQRTKMPQNPTRTNTKYDKPYKANTVTKNNPVTNLTQRPPRRQVLTQHLTPTTIPSNSRKRNRQPRKPSGQATITSQATINNSTKTTQPKINTTSTCNTENNQHRTATPNIPQPIYNNNKDPKSDPSQYRPP